MKARISFYTTVLASLAFCSTVAEAQLGKPTESRPVTENDLVGKKICWNDGGSGAFGAGGQFTNSPGKHRLWLVTEPGGVKIGNGYTQYQILPDGSFYAHKFNGSGGSITGHREWWGKLCN